MKIDIKSLAVAGFLTALGVLMPTVFHLLGLNSGIVFLPMHFPVLLCGLVCGFKYGGISGFLVPLLCCLFTGAPPFFPVAAGMAVELCTYGIIAGLMRNKFNVYVSLIAAMLGGRLVYSLFAALFTGAFASSEAVKALAVTLFATSLPGVAMQIVIIPALAFALYRVKLTTLNSDPFLIAPKKGGELG